MNLNLRSFLDIAPDSDFSMHNLPYGVFCPPQQSARVGVAIGEYVLDLSVLETAGLLPIHVQSPVFKQDSLNAFIELGADTWHNLRERLQEILSHDCPDLRDNATLRKHALHLQSDVTLLLPVKIGGYTDFYSSKEHAYNVGCMFRDPANALLPNWSELPVGYNGRASSVVVSGTDVVRPNGQIKLPNTERPVFGACRKLDFELETGFIIGKATALGDTVALQDAPAHIFGMVLLNDWSARDIQQWEYVPLGPFNAKTFATSISPWVVTMAALEPFKHATPTQEPKPLSYLSACEQHTFDMALQVALSVDNDETILANTNFKYLYWSMAQQLTHHTSGGCNVQIGDLMGSGTISGAEKYERGSMLELTWNNSEPVLLNNGLNRGFLEDGDTIIMRGVAQKDGIRVGFGEVRGCILPAKSI